MEVWKAIEGTYGCIEVSNKGRVRSWLRGEPRVLKTQADKKGYQRLRVTIRREKMTFKVHREVAKAFIPNPDNLPQVNHMDGNKSNNAVENLEWCTNQQNVIHAFEMSMYGSDDTPGRSVKDIDYSKHRINRGARPKNAVPRRKGNELVWRNPNPKKPVMGYFNGESRIFESVSEAERELDSRHISDVLKGKRSHVKGWTFSYVEGRESDGNKTVAAERKAEVILNG